MPKKEILIKHTAIFSAYVLVVWGFYRFLFKFPEEVEELLIKPLVWLVPIYFLLKKEKLGLQSIGITTKKIIPATYLALGLGVLFTIEGVFVNFLKYGGVNFAANIGSKALFVALGLSLATAISEEIAFRGYLFNRVWTITGNEWRANAITSLIWALIHVPIAVFWWQMSVAATLGFLVLTTIFAFGSAFVFARTRNVWASVLLHVLWEWPIILFR